MVASCPLSPGREPIGTVDLPCGGGKQGAFGRNSSTLGTDWPAETPLTGRRKHSPRGMHAYGPSEDVTVNKTACPRQATCSLNDRAWNNKGSTFVCRSFCWFLRPQRAMQGRYSSSARLAQLRLPGRHRPESVTIGINRNQRGGTY